MRAFLAYMTDIEKAEYDRLTSVIKDVQKARQRIVRRCSRREWRAKCLNTNGH